METPRVDEFLKIDFNFDPIEKIKKLVSFPNSKVKRISFKEGEKCFYRFTFRTTFNYLDKKDFLSNEIYTFNSKPIDGNLSEYVLIEGSKKEINNSDFRNSYFAAKEELKKRIQKRTNEFSKFLADVLEKEKKKIEDRFKKETGKFQRGVDEIADNLMELAKKGDIQKINEQKRLIEKIKKESNFEELEKDKLRAIQLERQKHMLNVENSLEKLTVINYPVYIFTIETVLDNVKKIFVFEFDPISEKISGLNCDNCRNPSREILLCAGGHAVCKNCFVVCKSCLKGFCKKCAKNNCEICSKKICKDCSVRCFRCSRTVCKDHTKKDKVTGYYYCNNCLKRCSRCDELKDPYTFKVSKKTKSEICEDCYRKEMQGKVLEGVFE